MYFTGFPDGIAKLRHGRRLRPQILDATLETSTHIQADIDGGATSRWPLWARCCWRAPTARALAPLRASRWAALSWRATPRNIARTYSLMPGRRYSSNLVMYVSAADNNYVGVTGTFLGTAAQGVGTHGLLGAPGPRSCTSTPSVGRFQVWPSSRPRWTSTACRSGPCPSRASLSVTDLADLLALTGSTAQGNVGCDQLLRNDVNCTDVFTTGVDASGAISCASRRRLGQLAEHRGSGQRGRAELGDGHLRQHPDDQQHSQRRQFRHGRRRVHRDAATAASFAATGALAAVGLREPGLHLHRHQRRRVEGQRGLRSPPRSCSRPTRSP